MTTCWTCDREAELDTLPVRERIAADATWRVAHATGSALPGWLVLVPRRHVRAIADLTDEEAATLGTWQVRVSRALHAVTGCEKTYVIQLAEAEGYAHVHFHVVPRAADLDPGLRGPRVFGLLGKGPDEEVGADEVEALSARLAAELAAG